MKEFQILIKLTILLALYSHLQDRVLVYVFVHMDACMCVCMHTEVCVAHINKLLTSEKRLDDSICV